MALDLGEAGGTQPLQLLGEVGEAIGRIVLCAADLATEALMELEARPS